MIRTRVRWSFDAAGLRKKVRSANIRSLARAGAVVRGFAMRSIKVAPKASRPGKPPRSRRGLLKRSILFEAGFRSVVIGPSAGFVGLSATAHEFGGEYRGGTFPLRPFMGPALERVKDRLPFYWSASVR